MRYIITVLQFYKPQVKFRGPSLRFFVINYIVTIYMGKLDVDSKENQYTLRGTII